MTGIVDDYGHPLLPVTLRNPLTQVALTLDAWVDTGFTGSLMLLPGQIAALGLTAPMPTPALLADGSRVQFDTYLCAAEWFGTVRPVAAFAGSGKFALIGLLLLEDCRLLIDYPARLVSLTQVAKPS